MTTLRSRLTDLTVRLATEFKKTYTQIGDLGQLETSKKTSLVEAINEARHGIEQEQVINDKLTSPSKAFSSSKTVSVVNSLLSDSTIDPTHTWSSQRIRSAINTELSSLVRGSRESLDSLYELTEAFKTAETSTEAVLTTLATRVRYDGTQELTEAEKRQARDNIGVVGRGLVEDPPGSGLFHPVVLGLTEDPSTPGLYLV